MSDHVNLLGEPPATLLPANAEAEALLASGAAPTDVAAKFPAFALAWALLAEAALDGGRPVEAYAYARTGFHRCLAALATAAGEINETDEEQRCWTFLADSSKEAYEQLKK